MLQGVPYTARYLLKGLWLGESECTLRLRDPQVTSCNTKLVVSLCLGAHTTTTVGDGVCQDKTSVTHLCLFRSIQTQTRVQCVCMAAQVNGVECDGEGTSPRKGHSHAKGRHVPLRTPGSMPACQGAVSRQARSCNSWSASNLHEQSAGVAARPT